MSPYNNMLILQELSNNEVNLKIMEDELRVNFRFHSITGIRNSFCEGKIRNFLLSLPCLLKAMTVELLIFELHFKSSTKLSSLLIAMSSSKYHICAFSPFSGHMIISPFLFHPEISRTNLKAETSVVNFS